jgi:transposase
LDEPINTAAASLELALIDAGLGRAALGRPEVLRLMTIPGVDTTVALSIVAAVGDFTRFRTPNRLVSYFGFNPRGASPAATRPAMSDHQGRPRPRPQHAGRGHLVRLHGTRPAAAFYQRVRACRGMQVAAASTARKLAVLCWHLIIKGEDYAFALAAAGCR